MKNVLKKYSKVSNANLILEYNSMHTLHTGNREVAINFCYKQIETKRKWDLDVN